MATFRATFSTVENRAGSSGSTMPVMKGAGAVGTTALTTSASAQTVQRGGGDWTAPTDGYVTAYCDGFVRMAVDGTAATGASPAGHLVTSAGPVSVSIESGQALSVIDA